ncbi:MAG: ribbon-helix-helix domain-containing protein [Cystobacterineae bacterium]|nr:ribbon-helix-helix domain-containing protein [Cystobacterineae bacterium]
MKPAPNTSPSSPASCESSASTHVLVSAEQLDKLRELSRKTRIAQSEYLREAVDDLLAKYPYTPL